MSSPFARTTVEKTGVRYQIIGGGLVVWEQFVKFGRSRRNCAGGAAFREAAYDQTMGLIRIIWSEGTELEVEGNDA